MFQNFRPYCSSYIDQYQKNISIKIQDCLKQKEFKQYSTSIQETEVKMDVKNMVFSDRNIQFMLFAGSKARNVYKEVLLVDEISLIGSLGGSLGLFIGFSFFGFVTPFVDALIDKVANHLHITI